ncbi:MAG: hypothetical protein FJX66_10565 [Alphaproteobacteria bacterium]|nr:hypothetical protein [Alphaproteobacteria bacterium]
MVVRTFIATLALLAAGQSAVALAAAEPPSLVAMRVGGKAGAIDDPNAAHWAKAQALKIVMQAQSVVAPQNLEPSVAELSVRAAHNGQWIAFLIEWADPTKSDRIVVDRFGDQVAVELPVNYEKDAPPNVMMGQPDGGRVTIMQWRAAFQRDLDEGEQSIEDLYPFTHVDIYPDEVLRASDARAYMGSVGVDNPIGHPKRVPVLDQMAEGWGTLTVKPEQNASGKGVWQDGRWRVLIARPMATDNNEYDPRLAPGDQTVAAFAVWEGGNAEVGGRKAWSDWVDLAIGK